MAGEPKYTIGRDKTCNVPIADDSVSRLHAEISLSDRGQIVLTDLRSANGTRILRGGAWIEVRTEILQPADEIRFGDVTLSARDLQETIERRIPGALSVARPQAPPAPPSPGLRPAPAPGPAQAAGTNWQPAPIPPVVMGGAAGGRVVRCECGAIKTLGIPCPTCQR